MKHTHMPTPTATVRGTHTHAQICLEVSMFVRIANAQAC